MAVIVEYINQHRRELELLDKLRTTASDEDYFVLNDIIHHLRSNFFKNWKETISNYFLDYNREQYADENTEVFVNLKDKVAIAKYNGYWYLCNILDTTPGFAIEISPPDGSYDAPAGGEDYPEYLIAQYIIQKQK